MDLKAVFDDIDKLTEKEEEQLLKLLNITSEEFFSRLDDNMFTELNEMVVYKAQQLLLTYIPPFLLILGSIGNLLTILVLKSFRQKNSTIVFLCTLSVLDFCVLWIGLGTVWLKQISGFDIQTHTAWLCKLFTFLGYVCSSSSVWLILTMTTERFIAVHRPLKVSILCPLRRVKYVIPVPIGISVVVHSHFLITVGLPTNGVKYEHFTCEALSDFKLVVNDVWPWIDAAIYAVLPFCLLVLLSGLIIRKVWFVSKKKVRKLRRSDSFGNAEKTNKTTTNIRLLISLCFLVTVFPFNVVLIVTIFWNKENHDVHSTATFMLIKTIAELLMYTNHAINFFLYILTGSKFRRQFLERLRCCSQKMKRHSLMPSEWPRGRARTAESMVLHTLIRKNDW